MDTKSLQIAITNGFELLKKRHHLEAKEIFLKLEKSFPDKTEIIKGLGLGYFYTKSYEKAIEYFNKYVKYFPDDSKYLRLLANAHMFSANYPKAQELFLRLLYNKHDHKSNSLIKNILFCIDKDTSKNKPNIYINEELLRLCPDNPRILSLLSRYLIEAEKYADAYALSKRLVILKPDNPVYAYLHYRNSYAIQEYDEAFQVIQPFTVKYPNDYRYAYYVGLCLFGLERYSEAIECFIVAEQLFPLKDLKGKWIFFFDIGACYLKLGENKKAEQYLLRSINSKQNNHSYYELGNLYYSEEKYCQAKEIYSKILDKKNAKEAEEKGQSKELIPVPSLLSKINSRKALDGVK